MYELRIFDMDNERRSTISNCEIINAFDKVEANITKGEWSLFKGAYGYGEYICSLEDELRDKYMITVDGNTLFDIIKLNEEYFFHVHLHKCHTDIQFGLFDSTFYFVRSENSAFLKKLQLLFKNTCLTKVDIGSIHPPYTPYPDKSTTTSFKQQ